MCKQDSNPRHLAKMYGKLRVVVLLLMLIFFILGFVSLIEHDWWRAFYQCCAAIICNGLRNALRFASHWASRAADLQEILDIERLENNTDHIADKTRPTIAQAVD